MAVEYSVKVVLEAVLKNFRESIKQATTEVSSLEGSFDGANKKITETNDRVNETTNGINGLATALKTTLAAVAAYLSVDLVVSTIKDMAETYGSVQSAMNEMLSLGFEATDILQQAAIDFSNEWSGTTAEGFIKAAYDIKSGIASLTDDAVGEFTKMAALTAKATKSTTENMTELFAISYNIYGNQFENSVDFANQMSAGISKSVQQFLTTGDKTANFLSTLGAGASAFGVELAEVLAIGGTAGGTNISGQQVANRYDAFLRNAYKASEALEMNFLDLEGKLLPAVDIVDMLTEKFGLLETNQAAALQLQQAWGDTLGVEFIKVLQPKTDEVRAATDELSAAMIDGIDFTEAMAGTMNDGYLDKIELIGQAWDNLKTLMGEPIAEALTPALDNVRQMLVDFQSSGQLESLANGIVTVINYVINLGQTFVEALAPWMPLINLIVSCILDKFAILGIQLQTMVDFWGKVFNSGFVEVLTSGLEFVVIKFYEFQVKVLSILQGIVNYIPVIGETLANSVGSAISVLEHRLSSLQNQAISVAGTVDLDVGEVYGPMPLVDVPTYSYTPTTSTYTPTTSSDSTGVVSTTIDRGILDDIDDINDKYATQLNLYGSREDLAEATNDDKGVELNRQEQISILELIARDLLGLENTVYGEDQNLVETARNKILKQIADITAQINEGINELIGNFNNPAELRAMTEYEYIVKTDSSSLKTAYANTNNIEIHVTFKGHESESEMNAKLNKLMNAMVGQGLNNVFRN
ncbi:MAG: hypothetical protein ATN35_02000 [Epulopiscium sp. Nele67-Bin004]|nr:MAG: hypothetical protein ATN35_02000 [Epulopiscium sp. Nele67-Bin004]